jgi:hypothetical protein
MTIQLRILCFDQSEERIFVAMKYTKPIFVLDVPLARQVTNVRKKGFHFFSY